MTITGWTDRHSYHRLFCVDTVGEVSFDFYWNPLRWKPLRCTFPLGLVDFWLSFGPIWITYIRLGRQ